MFRSRAYDMINCNWRVGGEHLGLLRTRLGVEQLREGERELTKYFILLGMNNENV